MQADRDSWNAGQEAVQLHSQSLVWDAHGCMPLRADDSHLHELDRYHRAGVDMVQINVGSAGVPLAQCVEVIAHMRWWLEARPEYVLAQGTSDIERAKALGKLAVGFNLEGASPIGTQLSLVSMFYDLGVRWMAMVYNQTNLVGGGCQDEDPGLSSFGRTLLDEMARVGMLACCSHTGYRTSRDVLEYSRNPVIFSHSNPRALHEHPRNIPDDLIRACAAGGGVVGINGVGLFLGGNDRLVERVVRHLDHAVQLVGPQHVGLGLDYMFDRRELDDVLGTNLEMFPSALGYDAPITFLEPDRMPEITEGLLKLGYPAEDVAEILGGNFMRLAKQVWK